MLNSPDAKLPQPHLPTSALLRPPERVPLRRTPAAEYVRTKWGIPCAPKTLAKLFSIGGGPLARLAGRIPLYDPADLDEWAASKLSRKVRSSSEAA
jgi:hypothetical protein